MEEGRVADESRHLLVRGLGETAGRTHGRSHANDKVPHGQGRLKAEGVAPDVRGIDRISAVDLFDRVQGCPVRTTGAQGGRSSRQRRQVRHFHRSGSLVLQAEVGGHGPSHEAGIVLEKAR